MNNDLIIEEINISALIRNFDRLKEAVKRQNQKISLQENQIRNLQLRVDALKIKKSNSDFPFDSLFKR